MKKTLSEIAEIIGGHVDGNPDTIITGVSGIKEAASGDITFVANPKYASLAQHSIGKNFLRRRESVVTVCLRA